MSYLEIKIFIISGVPIGFDSNGASFVNTILIKHLYEDFSCDYLYPDKNEWILVDSLGNEKRISNIELLENMIQNIPDIVIQLHSWHPEIFSFTKFRYSKKILLLHSIKAESFQVERKVIKNLSLNINLDSEFLKLQKERQSIDNSDVIITVSKSEQKIIKKIYNKESIVIYNPFENKYYANNTKSNCDIEIDNKNQIIVLGRLDIRKPIHKIIESFKLNFNENSKTKLIICGYSNEQIDKHQKRHYSYYQYIKSLINSGNIILLNNINRNKVKCLLESSLYAIVPSIYDSFSYATLEALVFSKHPIISNKYGPHELNGYFHKAIEVDFNEFDFSNISVNNFHSGTDENINLFNEKQWILKWKKIITQLIKK